MARSLSTRTSAATVLFAHLCIYSCLWVKYIYMKWMHVYIYINILYESNGEYCQSLDCFWKYILSFSSFSNIYNENCFTVIYWQSDGLLPIIQYILTHIWKRKNPIQQISNLFMYCQFMVLHMNYFHLHIQAVSICWTGIQNVHVNVKFYISYLSQKLKYREFHMLSVTGFQQHKGRLIT